MSSCLISRYGFESLGYALSETFEIGTPSWFPFDWMPAVRLWRQLTPLLVYRRVGAFEESMRICQEQRWPVLALFVDVEEPQACGLRDLSRGLAVAVLEIPGKAERPELYYAVDGHWTPAGHAFVAARILDRLPELGLSRPGRLP